MSEAHNQQDDLWVDVPEPEEIDEKEVHALPIAIDPGNEPEELFELKVQAAAHPVVSEDQ